MDGSAADRFGAAVRARRAELGITMDQLAAASGVSRGTLSRIETNALSTSLANAVAVADALGQDLSDLLAPRAATLLRAGDAQTYTDPAGIERTALARPAPGVELVAFHLPLGARTTEFAGHSERTTETIHVVTGRCRYHAAGQDHDLLEGDTLTIRADTDHSLSNTGTQPCHLHLLITTPR